MLRTVDDKFVQSPLRRVSRGELEQRLSIDTVRLAPREVESWLECKRLELWHVARIDESAELPARGVAVQCQLQLLQVWKAHVAQGVERLAIMNVANADKLEMQLCLLGFKRWLVRDFVAPRHVQVLKPRQARQQLAQS